MRLRQSLYLPQRNCRRLNRSSPLAKALADPAAADWNPQISLFSKHLQFLNYLEMAEVAHEIGFDGIDLTVRPGGHVEPRKVAENLPKAHRAITSTDLTLLLIRVAPGINSAEVYEERKDLQ